MTPRPNDYYDLIKYGFADESYQEFVDMYLAHLQNGRKTTGFDWDSEIQIDFTYHQVQAELGLNTMPTYVDVDSPGVYKHTEGFQLSSGTIPRAKHGFSINEKIIREEMIFAQRVGKFSTNMAQKMRDLVFDNTAKLIGGNYNGLTYQRDQMVSKGSFVLDAENNPAGLKNITFSARIPEKNRITLTGDKRWFIDADNVAGSKSNPLKDLRDMVYELKRKGVAKMHFEVDYLTFRRCLEHKELRTVIALAIYPHAHALSVEALGQMVIDDETLKAKLETLIGCPIQVIDNIVASEKWDKTQAKVVKHQMRSFAENVWVLVPDGKLGTIKAVEPIAVADPAARLAWYDGGRTILKQWYDTKTNTQYIESELTALVVPDKPQYMMYLTIA